MCGEGWDINTCWFHFLPMLLSSEHRSWFSVNLEPHVDKPWSFARARLIEDLDVDEADRLAELTDQLMNVRMQPSEMVALFTAQFEKLRHDAKAEDTFVMVNKYVDALLPDLQDRVYTASAGAPTSQKSTVASISSLALALEKGVAKARNHKASRQRDASPPPSRSSSHDDSSSSSGSSSSVREGKRRRSNKPLLHCEFHSKGNHATQDCKARAKVLAQEGSLGAAASVHNPYRASSSSSAAGSSLGSSSAPSACHSGRGKPCNKCGAPSWTP